jgi:hypothetical protein
MKNLDNVLKHLYKGISRSFNLWRQKHRLHWSTKILSHEEKYVYGVFLDAEFKYVSRISRSPTSFALHQTV